VAILGLSGLAHDSSAALLQDGEIAAAIEEGKLIRSRSAPGIPRHAIRFCMERSGYQWRDVEVLAVASRPVRTWVRHAWLRTRLTPLAPVPSGYYQTKALGELGRELNNGRLLHLLGDSSALRVRHIEHHICHAASAFYASPADRAVVLTLDEQGDGWSASVALGEGTQLRMLHTVPYPHSLGWVFSQVTDLIGFEPHRDEHKTLWLGLEGEPVFTKLFLKMLRGPSGGPPRLSLRYFNRGLAGRIAFSSRFYREVGLDPSKIAMPGEERPSPPLPEALRKQLAASAQRACATIAADWAELYRKKTGARWLCLAGGVFLNPAIVDAIEQSSAFDHIFVQPAAGNEGTALGAGWFAWHEILGKPRVPPLERLDFGPSFTNQEVKQVLDNCKARYSYHESEDSLLAEALRLLEAGKILGCFDGAAEFGPRALGNRSLLASPWAPYVKDNLNEYVKHREAFRPFAISVSSRRAGEYFQVTPAAKFMATLGRVRPETRSLLEGFLLPGDRVRLHVVEAGTKSLLSRLLEKFGERAPAPMLVNTSFNLFGEPLVVTPRDAVRSFFCSGMDAMIIGNFSVLKQ